MLHRCRGEPIAPISVPTETRVSSSRQNARLKRACSGACIAVLNGCLGWIPLRGIDREFCTLRIDENPPSLATIDVTTTQGDPVRYRLLGLPIYLAWRAIESAARIAR